MSRRFTVCVCALNSYPEDMLTYYDYRRTGTPSVLLYKKSCLANTGQRARKRDLHKYKRAHTSLDGVTTVSKAKGRRQATLCLHMFSTPCGISQRLGGIRNTGIRRVLAGSKYRNTEYGGCWLGQNTGIRNTEGACCKISYACGALLFPCTSPCYIHLLGA